MIVNVDVRVPWYHQSDANKELQKQRNRERYQEDPERERKYRRDYYHRSKTTPENIKKRLLKYAKHRAVVKNVPFTITESDLTLPEVCPILGVPLSTMGRRYSYSVDRINPELGYVPGNVWVISQVANAMKWDSTPEERLAFAKWVLSSEKGGGS